MNKTLLLACATLSFFISCRKLKIDDWQTSFEQRFVFQHEMKIDTFSTEVHGLRYVVADSGAEDVFLYTNIWGHRDDISDNEYSTRVWFPVAAGQSSFIYTDHELVLHRCFYQSSGAWGGYGFEPLKKGTITGTKNPDGSWDISIDVYLDKEEPKFGSSRVSAKATYAEGDYYRY